MLERIRARLAEINAEVLALSLVAEARSDGRLLASEDRKYTVLRAERDALEARVVQLEDDEQRAAAGADVRRRLGPPLGSDGQPFGRGADTVYARGSGNSYFRDLASLLNPASGAGYEALRRLNAHAETIERASSDIPAAFRAGPGKRAANMEARVNPNRSDGTGGYFVPPLWLVSEFVAFLRAGRAVADRCALKDLPPGTDSINLPKFVTGTATGVQTGDAQPIVSQDFTDTSIVAAVKTIAGQQDVSLQLLEQSPLALDDEVIFKDLIADFNQKLDLQVIAGSGAAGQLAGILNTAGVNAVTYTDATPSLGEMYVPVLQALSAIARTRFQPADCICLHPSLWYWICSILDSTGRPVVDVKAAQMFNSIAVADATAAEGCVGSIAGVDVCVDANIPTNLGAGVNETRVIPARFSDLYLWEGAMRTRALMDVLSGTLQVRLQVYNYVAFMPNRYPSAISVVSGSGMVSPAGF